MASILESAPWSLTSRSVHPHTLTLVHTSGGALLKCDGCQQPIADEPWYQCHPCKFDLHIPCTLRQSTIAHPLFPGCHFTLARRTSAGNSRTCDACGEHVLGSVYHSQGVLDLHPCCASLKESIVHNGREFHLCNQAAGACNLCGQDQNGRRGKFWTYASYHGGVVNMHVACLLYGHHNRLLSGTTGTGLSRSISTSSNIRPAFAPSRMMAPSPSWSHPGPATGTSRSISTSSSTQPAFTPSQMMAPSPTWNPSPIGGNGNGFTTLHNMNTVYNSGKNVTELTGAVTTCDWIETDTLDSSDDYS